MICSGGEGALIVCNMAEEGGGGGVLIQCRLHTSLFQKMKNLPQTFTIAAG